MKNSVIYPTELKKGDVLVDDGSAWQKYKGMRVSYVRSTGDQFGNVEVSLKGKDNDSRLHYVVMDVSPRCKVRVYRPGGCPVSKTRQEREESSKNVDFPSIPHVYTGGMH